MIDCLIIGHNDYSFQKELNSLRIFEGTNSMGYQNLYLNCVEYNKKYYRFLDLLNEISPENTKKYHNGDSLWLSIMCLGSYLYRNNKSFDYINSFQIEKNELERKLRENEYRCIAITTTLYVSPNPIIEIISFIRKINHKIPIVLGGPFIDNYYKVKGSKSFKAFFKSLQLDYCVVSNEGEKTLLRLLEKLNWIDSDMSEVPNLVYFDRSTNEIIVNKQEAENISLTDSCINYNLFKDSINGFLNLRTAKSCPFACAFCNFPVRLGKYTYLDIYAIEKELDKINSLGNVHTISIIDDTFNVPKKRFKEILNLIIKNKYSFKWNCFYRSDNGDNETVDLMKKANCEGVFLGIESGSDTILKNMEKTARKRHYEQAIRHLNEVEILTHANFIIGFPGETKDTLQETREFIEYNQPNFYTAELWFCDVSTPIWKDREKYGLKGNNFDWEHRTMNSSEAIMHRHELFMDIKNSIWMPQNGFEFWSFFYLLRKGLNFQELKDILKAFNGIKRKQIKGNNEYQKEMEKFIEISKKISHKNKLVY